MIKVQDSLYEELKQVSAHILELFNGIEDRPRLIMLRLEISKYIITQMIEKLNEDIDSEELLEIRRLVKICNDSSVCGFIKVNK